VRGVAPHPTLSCGGGWCVCGVPPPLSGVCVVYGIWCSPLPCPVIVSGVPALGGVFGFTPPTTLSIARPPAHTARTTHPQMTRWMGVHRAHRPLPEEHRPLPRGDGMGGHHTHTHRLTHTLHYITLHHITLYYNTSCYITLHYIPLLTTH